MIKCDPSEDYVSLVTGAAKQRNVYRPSQDCTPELSFFFLK